MKRILIIEDHAPLARNLETILGLEGFEVTCRANGADGLAAAREWRPDLVLCDVMMPGCDGHEVLRRIRTDPELALIPFIFVTARAERGDLRVGMDLGADDYLTKPFTRDELLSAIQTRLQREAVRVQALEAAASATGAEGGGVAWDFSSPAPLEKALGITPREAEVLLWVAQGKSNADIAGILGMAEKTVKKHLGNIFEKLGLEGRNAATVAALEVLSGRPGPRGRAG